MRGERKLSRRQIQRMGALLQLRPEQIQAFEAHLEQDYQDFSVDHFTVMTDWYHYAIYELVTVKDFVFKNEWIAKRLNITPKEAGLAVERLIRVGLLKIDEKGTIRQSTPFATTVNYPFTTEFLRQHQKQLLGLSTQALDSVPLELRDHSATVFAINTEGIPAAKALIKKFRRKLCAQLQKNSERDAVYQVQISFFPVTPVEGKRS
jgi:uncharacterized protein (TIGR02147 family)